MILKEVIEAGYELTLREGIRFERRMFSSPSFAHRKIRKKGMNGLI